MTNESMTEEEWQGLVEQEEKGMREGISATNETDSYQGEINIFVRTQEGYEAHVKLSGVPSDHVVPTLVAMSARLSFVDVAPSARNGGKASPVAPKAADVPFDDDVTCNYCHGQVWDNSEDKRSENAPDYKCKSKTCGGAAWIKTDGELNWKPGLKK